MADSVNKPTSTAANKLETKGEGKVKRLLRGFKQPKSANASASQLNSIKVSVPSVSGAHEFGPGNNTKSAGPTASGGNATLHPEPTPMFLSARPPSLSVPDLSLPIGRAPSGKTSLTSTPTAQPASTDPQTQVPDWKESAKEGLGVASRFAHTLLKKVPDCVDGNPVKMAFSIANMILEIKDAVDDNKDELEQCLKETAKRLLAVKERIVSAEAAKQAIEELKQILGKEMGKLQDLSNKWLVTQVLDHEDYKKRILQIFQCVENIMALFQFEIAISIQNTTSQLQDDTKKAALERLRPSNKADHRTLLEEQALKREECTAGMWVKILDDITKWANDSSSASAHIFWLTGQAGSGKTTIAYTIAKVFEKGGNTDQPMILGGNFLCSGQFEET